MKNFDYKHIAFHIVSAVYYIWVAVFTVLIGMALGNVFAVQNPELNSVFMMWIFLNLVTGTALFLVLRQFNNRKLAGRFILHSYLFMAALAITAAIIISVGF